MVVDKDAVTGAKVCDPFAYLNDLPSRLVAEY
jgi:hypothetical protein